MAFLGRPSQRDEERAAAYRDWLQQRNPFAIASVVLGVISLIEFGVLLVFGIAGIVCGIIALVQLSRARREAEGLPEMARRAELVRSISTIDYAPPDRDLPPPRDRDEADEPPVPKTRGRRLAWIGIALSVISLVIAAVIYTWPAGGAGGGGA
jgi:hypothetical protein